MNPYAQKGSAAFWKTGVADVTPSELAPLPAKRFRLREESVLATAGSCFAQNVTRYLSERPWPRVLMAEELGADEPLFSARYGNIYTVRQLVQLFDQAFDGLTPQTGVLQRADGRYVDALRPYLERDGFDSPAAAMAARKAHLEAVRRVFTECGTFVFTLGLTETWMAADGIVYPVAPGVVSDAQAGVARFHNFSFSDVAADIDAFVARLARVNAGAKVLLTVSPVPLTATYTDEHVMVATAASKAILRAACGEAQSKHANVYYFPAFEIITGAFSRGAYFEPNLRSVRPEGVAHVMRVFDAAYCQDGVAPLAAPTPPTPARGRQDVVCDEEEITKSLGFD